MISLNGIQIDEVELKRQLEAQGLSVVPTPEPSHPFKVGDVVWCQHKVEAANRLSYVISRALPGDPMSDELIRAYDELYEATARLTQNESVRRYGIERTVDKIAALKAQGEKR